MATTYAILDYLWQWDGYYLYQCRNNFLNESIDQLLLSCGVRTGAYVNGTSSFFIVTQGEYHEGVTIVGAAQLKLDKSGGRTFSRDAVRPEHRGKGVHQNLIYARQLHTQKSNRKDKKIKACIHPENKASIRNYTRAGFVNTDDTKRSYAGSGDLLLFLWDAAEEDEVRKPRNMRKLVYDDFDLFLLSMNTRPPEPKEMTMPKTHGTQDQKIALGIWAYKRRESLQGKAITELKEIFAKEIGAKVSTEVVRYVCKEAEIEIKEAEARGRASIDAGFKARLDRHQHVLQTLIASMLDKERAIALLNILHNVQTDTAPPTE